MPVAALAAGPILAAAGLVLESHRRVRKAAAGRIVTDPSSARADLGVVLGAGLRPDGSPTGLLCRRVDGGVALLAAGSVDRLLMSGDIDARGDQTLAMAQYAGSRGVPADVIDVDPHGYDTAATCRGLPGRYPGASIVFVTQEFHARRTAYLAARAGLDATVLAVADADVRRKALVKARVREVPAAVKAVFVDRL